MNMQKVFLDTNVLLDYLFDYGEFAPRRSGYFGSGSGRQGVTLCFSTAFANIAYIARRKYKGELLYALLENVHKMCEVAPVGESVIDNALLLQVRDFEDAIQYCSGTCSGV